MCRPKTLFNKCDKRYLKWIVEIFEEIIIKALFLWLPNNSHRVKDRQNGTMDVIPKQNIAIIIVLCSMISVQVNCNGQKTAQYDLSTKMCTTIELKNDSDIPIGSN